MYQIVSTELYHHGILGQKWGIRRFQNPDGTLTEAGRKRYQKHLYNAVRKSGISSPFLDGLDGSVRKEILQKSEQLIDKEDFAKLNAAKKAWLDAEDKYEKHRYFESKEYKEDHNKAYEETVNWFKKNKPEYFKDMKSKTDDFLTFHDFRTFFEGTEDHYISIGKNSYYKKHPEYKIEQEQANKLYSQYSNLRKDIGKKITGSYANKKINSISNKYDSLPDMKTLSYVMQMIVKDLV